jgi:hypothetical protein
MQYQSGTQMTSGTACLYLNRTAGTALVKTSSGQIYGATINSHASGTLRLWDSASTATVTTGNE